MITVVVLLAVALFETVITALPAPNSIAPRHGGDGGHELSFACPYNGAFTAINYRSGLKVDQLSFVCSSWVGRTTFGPYGGGGGSPATVACPQKHYISSIYGRSDARLDQLGIRCRHESDMTSHGQDSGDFGGMGGRVSDDVAYSYGARPIAISVRSGDDLDAIQITYGNNYLAPLCTDCSRQLNFIFENKEEWAPKHGGSGGTMHAFVCPNEGIITGISYRAGSQLDLIQFTCVSTLGQSTAGPYGGDGGASLLRDNCDPGFYISSILGRSSGIVDQLGIRCVRPGDTATTPGRHGHGGNGGEPFDDEIRVWSGSQVDAIQIKYANMPVIFPQGFGENEVTHLLENDFIDNSTVASTIYPIAT